MHVTIAVAGLIVCGCTNANVPLNGGRVPPERRAENATRAAVFADVRSVLRPTAPPTTSESAVTPGPVLGALPPADRDGCFVGLCLSGGGSRSANFSAACMFQLQRVGLLRHVDYISSVSGGSLTAAYYCTHDREWNPKNVQEKLTHSFAGDLLGQVLLPWNQAALLFTDWDRSDILAGSFQQVLYTRDGKGLTYADLRPDRPRLLINATDLQSGRRFVFCNESFDELNSDLSKYPIAYAVAASAAVPIILHPVTLRDYSTDFPQYRHLIDGGVTDNLGLQTLTETYAAQVRLAQYLHRPDPYPNGAVFIVVDAHTQFNAEISDKGDVGVIESLKTAAGLTSTLLLNRASSATLAEIIVRGSPNDATAATIRRQIAELNDSGYLRLKDRTGHEVRIIYLSLSQVNHLQNLPFVSFSESVNNIATYFNIEQIEAYHLYEAAELLVKEQFEPRLREIVKELEGAERAK